MTSPPNIAVAGMGYWGKNLVRNFHALGALHTVCDSDTSRGDVVRGQYPDAHFTADFASVLASTDITGIALATPAERHYDMARAALLAGKDVFVEKPLALELAHAEELTALADDRQAILRVGHLLEYHPAVRKLKEIVDSGELGKVHYVYSNRLSLGKIRWEENVLWSFAPHDISVMILLLGAEPRTVAATGAAYVNQQIADVTVTTIEFPGDVKGHIFVSWLNPYKEQKLVVVGSDKMAEFNDTAAHKLVVYPHKIEWRHQRPVPVKAEGEPVPVDAAEPLRVECQHFLDCIATRQRPQTDGANGIRVLKVLAGCQRSLDAGGAPVSLSAFAADAGSRDTAYFAHPTATIDEGCEIGEGTKIWHYSHVMPRAKIGKNCNLGQNVFVASDVTIGDSVKIQNNVSVYKGVTLEDNVFCGPSMVFTNVLNPRSEVSRRDEYRPTLVKQGATLGANCTIVCGHTIGRYAFVGAGATVSRDIPDYALVYGDTAQPHGWMCRCGEKIDFHSHTQATCEACGRRYRLQDGAVLPQGY